MTTSTMFTLLVHSAEGSGPLTVRADKVGKRGMAVVVQDRTGTADVDLRISAVDTADLHNLLMRMLTAVASTAARERPGESEPAGEPANMLPPCDACHSEPACVIDGAERLCAGCALARAGVGA